MQPCSILAMHLAHHRACVHSCLSRSNFHRAHRRQSETDPDEITVDLDEVDPATIRFLIQIVDEALAARKRKQGRASDEQEA